MGNTDFVAGRTAGTPPASSDVVRRRMLATRRRDTDAELELRRELHRRGYRYRVDQRPVAGLRSRADVLFPRQKVAVYVQGCFWHRCPDHATYPKANAQWWEEKLAANVERDARVDAALCAAGWSVVRVWEHEPAADAAERVIGALRAYARSAGGDPVVTPTS